MLKTGQAVTLCGFHSRSDIPQWVFQEMHALLNDVIRDGNTYPIEEELDVEGFESYFCPHYVAVLFEGVVEGPVPVEGVDKILGGFYIKPNYVGRSSHVCNGGFVVKPETRGMGCGEFMGRHYVEQAPKLGYKSSVFNLVYCNNPGSYRIWDKLQFTRLAVVPAVGRLRNSKELVDAYMYSKVF